MIELIVPGNPVPQPRPRISTRGGFSRAYVPATHPVHEYRELVKMAGQAATKEPLGGPIRVEISFTFKRPKSHWNKSGLKSTALHYPSKSDIDNCFKAATDALNGVCYMDDEQICEAVISRYYINKRDGEGSTAIRISQIGTDRAADRRDHAVLA